MFQFYPRVIVSSIAIALCGCAALPKTAVDDHWFAHDKAQHFAVSAVVAAAVVDNSTTRDCERVAISIGTTMALGGTKELYDANIKGTYFSYKDMLWNLVGASVGAIAAGDC